VELQLLDLVPLDPKDDPAAVPQPLLQPEPAPMPRVAATAKPESTPEISDAERFMAIASAEFERGNVDQMLWDRALAQVKDDRDAAIPIYKKARATILQVLERDQRARERKLSAEARAEAQRRAAVAAAVQNAAAPATLPRRGRLQARHVSALAAICLGLVVCISVWVILRGSASESSAVAATNSTGDKPVTAAARAEAEKKVVKAADAESAKKSIQELSEKIDGLREAGNWNVHVLYAGEWTRRDPTNAAAWNELGIGFEKLRQYDDAYVAANKAVALAPGNGLYWRNLGLLDVQINQPEEALHAFNQAMAANDQDTLSVVQAGMLNLRLGRMAEAKQALDRALAANADDPGAVCLKALVARRQVVPKAAGSPGKPPEQDSGCRDPAEKAEAPPVVASGATVPVTPVARAKR
jgi:tetratricopeptide (TPR) repeat protein